MGLQVWQGNNLTCKNNMVQGSDMSFNGVATFTTRFKTCQNVTGGATSRRFGCDAKRENFIVSQYYGNSDCSGPASAQETYPVGCSTPAISPNQVLLVFPAFCDYFHDTLGEPPVAVSEHMLRSPREKTSLLMRLAPPRRQQLRRARRRPSDF